LFSDRQNKPNSDIGTISKSIATQLKQEYNDSFIKSITQHFKQLARESLHNVGNNCSSAFKEATRLAIQTYQKKLAQAHFLKSSIDELKHKQQQLNHEIKQLSREIKTTTGNKGSLFFMENEHSAPKVIRHSSVNYYKNGGSDPQAEKIYHEVIVRNLKKSS